MHRLFLAGLTLGILGCGNPTEALKQEMAASSAANKKLQAEVVALRTELREALEKVKDANDSTARQIEESQKLNQELGSAWVKFKESYSPEMQKALAENVEATDKAKQRANSSVESSAKALLDMKKLVAQANKLKAECAEHAKEAAALNELGSIKSLAVQNQRALKSLESKLSNVETVADRARRKADQADRKADDAESRARRAKSRADRAYNRAR